MVEKLESVILYTIDCPKCRVLESKLRDKQIVYATVSDVETLKEKGFDLFPKLEVNGKVMDFKQAVDWVNGVGFHGN